MHKSKKPYIDVGIIFQYENQTSNIKPIAVLMLFMTLYAFLIISVHKTCNFLHFHKSITDIRTDKPTEERGATMVVEGGSGRGGGVDGCDDGEGLAIVMVVAEAATVVMAERKYDFKKGFKNFAEEVKNIHKCQN